MRERRAAHVRPLPPSGERLRSHQIKASAPASEIVRRYRPVRTGKEVPAPLGMGVIGVFLILGVAMLIVGGNILVNVVGHVARAFDDAITQVSSLPPATMAPSGVALDTPVLDTPDNGGFTNQPIVSLSGNVPGAVIGKKGYEVRVYELVSDGTKRKVAELSVGDTTRFSTAAIKLAEGKNTFVAALVTPSSEGQPSPEVVYTLDSTPPPLTISSPADGSTQSGTSAVISGTSDVGATVTIRNKQSPGGGQSSKVVGEDGRFAITVGLIAGSNSITVTATDQAGNVTTGQLTVKRSFGKLAAHLAVGPSTFKGAGPTTLRLTARATSSNGGPLAGAKAVFSVTVEGLGPIVSPEVTTDQTGTATWRVTISGASAGVGAATLMVTTADGDQVTATTRLITT